MAKEVYNSREQHFKVLEKYLPYESIEYVVELIHEHHAQFRISKSRSSKLGDYRHPFGEHGHRISVNYNLNKYAFLITTIHEFAHLVCWNNHKNKVKPHGVEWKSIFYSLLKPLINKHIFPNELLEPINNYIANPAASSCSDHTLLKALMRYDDTPVSATLLEQLNEGAIFRISTGRVFIKGPLRRTRFLCEELTTKRKYTISSLVEVELVRP